MSEDFFSLKVLIVSEAAQERDLVRQAAAQASKESLEKARRYSNPIATQIVPAVTFYAAEDYHQQYLEKRGMASCHIKA